MNKEAMQNMTVRELEDYANSLGFTLKAATDKADKIDLLERKRARAATVSVLGLELSIEVKRFRSSKFADVINDRDRTAAKLCDAFAGLLGEEQYAKLIDACTEDDGEVDEDALAFAFATIIKSDELKKY